MHPACQHCRPLQAIERTCWLASRKRVALELSRKSIEVWSETEVQRLCLAVQIQDLPEVVYRLLELVMVVMEVWPVLYKLL